jgi:hypothetical protein
MLNKKLGRREQRPGKKEREVKQKASIWLMGHDKAWVW